MCHTIHRHVKANNKYMKDYNKKKTHHILSIWMQIIYTDEQYHRSQLQMDLAWLLMSEFNKDFIENYH